jgi:hypothetical protein
MKSQSFVHCYVACAKQHPKDLPKKFSVFKRHVMKYNFLFTNAGIFLLRGTLFQFGMFQVLFDFLSQVH